jgi:uncharacterized repeat protein (TIGR02543 family)
MKYLRLILFMLAVLLLTASPTFLFAGGPTQIDATQPLPPPTDPAVLDTSIPPLTGGAPYPYPIVYYTPPPAAPTAVDAPVITVWYGATQNFGQNGTPQEWINILGNVSGATSLKYSLNGGPDQTLSIGDGSNPRLEAPGDFNIELHYTTLNNGANTVVIKASDGTTQVTQNVTVNYTAGAPAPLPYVADWAALPNVQAGGQPVDGLWAINAGRLETVTPGYDRLVALGDMSWTDYEVTVPVTVLSLAGEGGTQPPDGSSGVGLIVRWQGHFAAPGGGQPNLGWRRLGVLTWYRWASANKAAFEMLGNGGQDIITPQTDRAIELGVPYIFKLSVQSSELPGEASTYRFKFWPAGQPEPPQWYLKASGRAGEPANGSVVLVAHNAMVSWGRVNVRPVGGNTFEINTQATANGDIIVTPDKDSYTYGERVQIRAQGDSGFGLQNWTGDLSGNQNPIEFDISEDITVGAVFQSAPARKLTVNTSGQGTVAISPNKNNYLDGEVVTLTPNPALGSIFAGWSGDLTGANNPATVVLSGDKTVVANFVSANTDSPVSDDFNACALDTGLWTFINPVGNGSFQVNGTQLLLNVPGGSSHNIWVDGNRSVRVMQPTQDVNFEIVTKFESTLSQRFQMQGILVEQDANNFLRYEVHHDGTTNKLYVAKFVNGNPTPIVTTLLPNTPGYLRITRVGTQWSLSYSNDGQTWVAGASFSLSLVVSKSGVFAANHGATVANIPAHTAIVDYFFNTAAPIVPEDGNTLEGFEVVANKVGQGTVTLSPAKDSYTCGEKVTVTATPAAGWSFAGWSGDLTGTNPSAELTVTGNHTVTATFVEGDIDYLIYLPVGIRP